MQVFYLGLRLVLTGAGSVAWVASITVDNDPAATQYFVATADLVTNLVALGDFLFRRGTVEHPACKHILSIRRWKEAGKIA